MRTATIPRATAAAALAAETPALRNSPTVAADAASRRSLRAVHGMDPHADVMAYFGLAISRGARFDTCRDMVYHGATLCAYQISSAAPAAFSP